MAEDTEPYIVQEHQECLGQLWCGGAGYQDVFILEHICEHTEGHAKPVSYTHMTLPTILLV